MFLKTEKSLVWENDAEGGRIYFVEAENIFSKVFSSGRFGV